MCQCWHWHILVVYSQLLHVHPWKPDWSVFYRYLLHCGQHQLVPVSSLQLFHPRSQPSNRLVFGYGSLVSWGWYALALVASLYLSWVFLLELDEASVLGLIVEVMGVLTVVLELYSRLGKRFSRHVFPLLSREFVEEWRHLWRHRGMCGINLRSD